MKQMWPSYDSMPESFRVEECGLFTVDFPFFLPFPLPTWGWGFWTATGSGEGGESVGGVTGTSAE